MTENAAESPKTETKEKPESVVDMLFDLAEAWAAHGLNMSKTALEGAAKGLAKTARALENIAARLEKKPTPDAEARPRAA